MEPKKDFKEIEKMYNVIEYLRVKLSHNEKECPIQKATIFLLVIMNEGITHTQLQKLQGFHQTTISRNLKELGKFKEKDPNGEWVEKGCGLVVTQPYEYNRREHAVFLSGTGRKVANKVTQLLS